MAETIPAADIAPFTIEQFYKFLKERKLMAAECRQCGSMFVPPRPMCTNCFSGKLNWVQLRNRGRLATYTVIYVAPQQFQSMAPYAYGIIELEDHLRLPGMIRGLELEKIQVGTELEVGFDTEVSSSWPQWSRYYFRPTSATR